MELRPPTFLASPADAEHAIRTFTLLGGHVDEAGRSHRDVDLRSFTGMDQAALQNLPGTTPLAVVCTAILARALRRVGSIDNPSIDLVRELLVGDRDFLVMKLYELTVGHSFWMTLLCPSASCGERMDLKLDLRELPLEEKPVSARYATFPGLPTFRLPNGGDQEAASRLIDHDPEAAVRLLLERCVSGENAARAHEGSAARTVGADVDLGAALVRDVQAHIAELSPAVDIELDAACPECGVAFSGRLDVVPRLVGELCGSARELEQEVHVIAWNYHWSEREILGLTRAKRRRYVELIDRQATLASSS